MDKILIAEDGNAVRDLVVRVLGEEGHELTATPMASQRSMHSIGTMAISTCC